MLTRRLLVSTAFTAIALTLALAFTQPTSTDPDFAWEELGLSVFNANCSACHGAQGAGIPGAFPPLAGHVTDLLAAEGGKELLANILVYGMVGQIDVNGVSYVGAMPAWGHLSDEEIAAVINHVLTSWGNADLVPEGTALLAPVDIAAERSKNLTAVDVHALRTKVLGLDPTASDSGETAAVDVINDETGYFTAAQAESGHALYQEHCNGCHGPTLRGGLHAPSITNLAFFREWGGRSFDTLYAFISNQMPINNPGGLRSSQYVDIAAYWLSFNKYPAGDIPLTADPALNSQILIERR